MNLRFSCRTFTGEPLGETERAGLQAAAQAITRGPFGTRLRLVLAAARPGDEAALKRLGTYGLIRGPGAFLIGAVERAPMDREDFGYAMERLVLEATELGLGTCWVGGVFTRGSFARRIGASRRERMPAVVAVGRMPGRPMAEAGLTRRVVGGSRRRPWETLFSDEQLHRPLDAESAGPFAAALETVRWAPSASNRQPWRVVRSGRDWHFFMQRTPGYPPHIARVLLGVEDLQRVDMGIALCHFELALRERGQAGRWVRRAPSVSGPDALTEYTATWEPVSGG